MYRKCLLKKKQNMNLIYLLLFLLCEEFSESNITSLQLYIVEDSKESVNQNN